jgi:hypothetical protein
MNLLIATAGTLAFILDVLVQIMFFRAHNSTGLLRSIKWGFLSGLAFLAVLYLVLWSFSAADLWTLIFHGMVGVLSFGSLSYGYFHFINLGETARRIRILREFSEAGGQLSYAELLARYNARTQIDIRLQRLLTTGQVVDKGGALVIGKGTVLRITKIMYCLRGLLFGAGYNPSLENQNLK